MHSHAKKKAKETKEEKRISVENLTEDDNIVWKFAVRACNLPDPVVSFNGCSYQKQPPEVFYKKPVLKNFSILAGKH